MDEESSTKLDFQQDPKDVSSTSGKRVEDDMHTFANLFVNAWEYTPFSFPWNDEEMKAMHNSEEVRFEEESLSECSNSHDQRRKTEAGQILDGSLVPNKRKGIHGPGEACEKQRVGDVIVGPSRGAQLVVSIHQNQEVQKELLNVPNEKEGKTDASVSVSGTSQHRKQGIDLTTRLDEYDHPLDEFDSPNPIRAFTTEESMASQPTYDLCDTDQPSDEEDVDRAAQSQMTQSTLPQTSSYSLGRKAQPLTPSKNSAFQSNQKMIVKESISCGSSEQEAGLNQNTMFGLRKRSKNNKHPYDHLEISFSGESYESQRWKDGNFNKYYVESIDSDSYTNSLVSTTDASASLEFETEEETIDTDEFETEDEESRADGNDTEAEGDVTEGFQTDDEREEINYSLRSGSEGHDDANGEQSFHVFNLTNFVGFNWGNENPTEEIVFESDSQSESGESEWSESYITSQDDDDCYTSPDDEEREDVGQSGSIYSDDFEERDTGDFLQYQIDSNVSEASTNASSDRGSSAMEDSTVGWDNTTTALTQKNPRSKNAIDCFQPSEKMMGRSQTQTPPTFYSISRKANMSSYGQKKQLQKNTIPM